MRCVSLVSVAACLVGMVCRGDGLPVARAPFARHEAAVRPVEFLTFLYRTGPIWSPSKETYRWAELVSGDKSVLVAGSDSRVPGLDGDVGAGFGHLAFYAGKGERQKPGAEFLGEVRLLMKDGASPEKPRASDRLTVDEARSAFTWARAWAANGTNGVFTYTVRADGPARIRATWDAGIDRPTWDRLRLGDRLDVSLSVPDDRPAPHRTEVRTWELNPSDPSKRVTLTLSEPGPSGVLTADFHTSTALVTPPLPETGGVDFWLTDAYDVPPKPGRNLMTNGGFEQGWKGWRTQRGAPLAAVTNRPGVRFAELVPDAHTGRRALRIDMRGEKADMPAFKSAPLALESGRIYTVSAWIRSERGGSVALIPAPEGSMVKQTWPGGRAPRTSFSADRTWTRHAVTFIASSQGTNIQLWSSGGSVWIDDVTVVEGEDAPDATGDPVEARLASADEYNYFHVGQPRQMRLELTGRPSLTGAVSVSVLNFYHETVFRRAYPFALDAQGLGEIRLDALDAAALGTGVFVVRLDYAAADVRWRDYARFTVIAPLDGTHPLAGFFAHFPWFVRGWWFSVLAESADFVAQRMREMGVGATSWQPNATYAQGFWAPYFRTYGIVNKLHALQADLRVRYPDRFGWAKKGRGLAAFTNAVPEELSFIEAEAYRSAREAATNDIYWAFANEEELWHPLIQKARDFDRYFEYQYACWKGLKRGFDERGLTFYYAPTHGTAGYCHPSLHAILDGYREAARKRGFQYTCISVHTYHAIDGSILGPGDREADAEHLLRRLAHYGYPDTTPILFPEGFNILPLHIPDWGAKDWADVYVGTIPSQALGLREALHAGAMARAYLIDLKRYPQLKVDHTWQTRPYMDDAFTPSMFTMVMNTLGRLLPDPRFVGDAHPYPDVRAYCFRPNPTATEGVLALWTSANDVENGLRTGDVLTLDLPVDATFVDLMGNVREPLASQKTPTGVRVPLTPAPLFIRAGDPQALLRAVRAATGGTALARTRRPVPFRLGVPSAGARPDWQKVAAIPLTNAVRGEVSATARLSWGDGALALRVEVAGLKEPTLDLSFDGLADARETAQGGWGPDDCAYRLKGTDVSRTRETNTQFRDGGADGAPLEQAEIAETLTRRWMPTADGGIWEIVLTPRFISPIRCERGCRFGLNVSVSSSEGACSLVPSDRPSDWPLVELK